MKQYKLVQVGNPTLRQPCVAYAAKDILSVKVHDTVERMKYTMRVFHGVGLAAPQIGLQKQLFVLRLAPNKFRPGLKQVRPYAVFNPEITSYDRHTEEDWEGCFSVAEANLFAKVHRSDKITVKYIDLSGREITKDLDGLEARVFQHEYDHLQGLVFLDRKPDAATFMSANEYKAMRQQESLNYA